MATQGEDARKQQALASYKKKLMEHKEIETKVRSSMLFFFFFFLSNRFSARFDEDFQARL